MCPEKPAGARHRHRAPRALVIGALALFVAIWGARAWAGCAEPEPELWLPVGERAAPLNSRITVSLGAVAGLVREVELQVAGSAQRVAAQARPLPGPRGHGVIELVPDAPLAPDTTYTLVARRPAGWHPSRWVFGVFGTSRVRDDVAPELRVLGARFRPRTAAGSVGGWVELKVELRDGERTAGAALYAVWLPHDGALDTSAPPDVYLPGRGDTLSLSLSSPDVCPGRFVPLPSTPGRLTLGVAAFDVAGNRSALQQVEVDVPSLPAGGGG